MYNNKYNSKIITATITAISKDRDFYAIHDKDGVVAITKYISNTKDIVLGVPNKLHIREDYRRDESFLLEVL